MKLLVVGSGGREHALAWKLARSPGVSEVLVAPGNAGTHREASCRNVDVSADDLDGLVDLARRESVSVTVVGPEQPLVAGIVDRFQAEGLACFGPTKAAAQLEGSKGFAKTFMGRHDIPTAEFGTFTDLNHALAYVDTQMEEGGASALVIKADGLAAGKGVVIAESKTRARRAVREMLAKDAFGEAGRTVVIEQFLQGEEVSFICMVDGEHILPLATSQDHKTRDEGDEGPNTGGMGAYSPAPIVNDTLERKIMDRVIKPTVKGLNSDGHPFTGFLYAGLMVADGEPYVLEYNVRFGDPETQPVMLRLKSDLLSLIDAALAGRLDEAEARWDSRHALGVVLASGGYPEAYEKGKTITGLDDHPHFHEAKVFHAGTTVSDGRVVTSGGRVLCVTALGHDLSEARSLAYAAAGGIHFEDVFYRRDIGHRALNRG